MTNGRGDSTGRAGGLSGDLSSFNLFRSIIETMGEAVIVTGPALDGTGSVIEYVNPALSRMTGYGPDELVGRSPRILQGAATDRAVLDRLRATLEAGQAFEGEIVNYRKDGTPYRVEWRITPTHDEAGRITRWIAIQRDVTASRQAQEEVHRVAGHHGHLLAQLQHRVRNTLAVIRSIARRSAETSESVEDYAMHLDGRLNAFSRVESAIACDPLGGIGLDHLVADELLASAAREGEQVHISGPAVLLQPKAAEMIGLALHELATNAVKFGALSSETGRVTVVWRIERGEEVGEGQGSGEPRLILDWIEEGEPMPAATEPRRRGFGTDMLENTLAYELQATARLIFGPRGLTCRIALPLTDRVVKRG